MERAHISFHFLFLVIQDLDSPQFITCPYAPAAQYTAVHIVQDQRILFFGTETFRTHLKPPGFRSDILDQHLELAITILRAGGTIFGMPRQ